MNIHVMRRKRRRKKDDAGVDNEDMDVGDIITVQDDDEVNQMTLETLNFFGKDTKIRTRAQNHTMQ